MATKKDKSEDDEVLTTQNTGKISPDESEESTNQKPPVDAPETRFVPTTESPEGNDPDKGLEVTDEESGDATENDSERVEISPDDVGSIEDVLGIGDAPETDGADSAEVNLSSAADVVGPYAASDANEGGKAEAVADSRPRPDDDDMKMEASEFITDVPVIRELKAAFKFLAAQLASQAEFEEIQRNFPNIFK